MSTLCTIPRQGKFHLKMQRLTVFESLPLQTTTSVAPTTSTMIGENECTEADENAPTPETIEGKEWISTLKL